MTIKKNNVIVLGKRGYQSPLAMISVAGKNAENGVAKIKPFEKFTIRGWNFTSFLRRGNPAVPILIDGKPLTGAILKGKHGHFNVTMKMPPFEPGKHIISVFGIEDEITVEDSGDVISATDLRTLIEKDFIVDPECHMLLSDVRYRVCPMDVLECYLGKSDVHRKKYIAEWFDCDDFSDALHGQFTFDTYPRGYAHGELWVYTPGGGHAINCFCVKDGNKTKMVVVEPQSNKIFDFPKNWKAFVVKM